jgi:hypothetical protein
MLLSRGLQGFWRLEGNANDSSGNGRDGTLYGDTTYDTGKFGKAGLFDGSGDYIDVGTSLPFGGEATIAAWIYTHTVANGDRAILSGYSGSSMGDLCFFINHDGGGKLGTYWVGYRPNGTVTLQVNTWTHVAFVRSGSPGSWTGKYYVNGVLDSSYSTSTNPGTGSIPKSIGRTGNYPGEYWDGLLDEVCAWNRPLAETDIRRVMLGMPPIG